MTVGLIACIARQNHNINNAYLSSVVLMAYQLLKDGFFHDLHAFYGAKLRAGMNSC
jgi:hypothetical protein